MKRVRQFTLLVGAVGMLSLWGCGGKNPVNEPILKIGETTITKDEYYKRLERLSTPIQVPGGGVSAAPASYATIVQLIREQIVLKMAKDAGVLPTDEEVKQRAEKERKNNTQINEALQKGFLTLEDFMGQVRVGLAEFNLRTRGVTVTDKEVQEAYTAYKKQFYKPDAVRVRFLSVMNPQVKTEIDQQIKEQIAFESIVDKYSKTAMAGVQAGEAEIPTELLAQPTQNMSREQFVATNALRTKLKTVRAGVTTEWMKVGQEWVKFQVLAQTKGHQMGFDEVKDNIREQLLLQKGGQKNKDLNMEIAKAMINTPTEVMIPFWQERFKKEMSELKDSISRIEKEQKKP
jgi:hypothetical protein